MKEEEEVRQMKELKEEEVRQMKEMKEEVRQMKGSAMRKRRKQMKGTQRV